VSAAPQNRPSERNVHVSRAQKDDTKAPPSSTRTTRVVAAITALFTLMLGIWGVGAASAQETGTSPVNMPVATATQVPDVAASEIATSEANTDFTIEDYDEAIRLNPQDAEAHFNRGNAYYALGELERAIEDYDAAIRLNPQLAEVYNNRGNAYTALGEYEHAIANYDEALRLNPEYATAYNNRGFAYYTLSDLERAIADYDEAIRLDPQNANAYYNRGETYFDLGDYERAIADYDLVIHLAPQYAGAYNNRGNAYVALGDYVRALADFTEAIHLDPQAATAYYNRAAVYYALSQNETDPAQELAYFSQIVSDARQAEELGLSLPTEIADYVTQIEELLATDKLTPAVTPNSLGPL
jgi:tetratricopeptide (TPR) repeat protein